MFSTTPPAAQILWRNANGDDYHSEPKPFVQSGIPHASRHQYKGINPRNDSGRQLAIILGYYNGEPYLCEQLHSIFNQTRPPSHIFISDDGSDTELSPELLEDHKLYSEKVSIGVRPENTGFANNFLNALSYIDEPFKYFAFSDQDDVWHPDKLEKALDTLEQYPENKPALYCARTVITDETCNIINGISPLFSKPPSFANALVQCIGGGNTMVFNKAARDLIVESSLNTEVVSHDWWCYQIISGAGGIVIYDREPCLKYRQHANNLVGANKSWKARFIRIFGLFQGRFRRWNDINLSALVKHRALLTQENQNYLDNFVAARRSNFIKRFFLFCRSGIYRQTLFGNLGLLLGITINKV
ncbi:glycosyltransferase [Salinisphaera sp. G21_0]|uniref:glycosyltransferase n=1 Tax=Salinisphaera sp. G21_0 TaxID=2821094 RepID=UPI001ADB7165|nr:glycosyltransferase [Salinisphaera sp. G21_0]MBO9484019.1 glycosyltransferase [Salinisphaera sp. G21_0]